MEYFCCGPISIPYARFYYLHIFIKFNFPESAWDSAGLDSKKKSGKIRNLGIIQTKICSEIDLIIIFKVGIELLKIVHIASSHHITTTATASGKPYFVDNFSRF